MSTCIEYRDIAQALAPSGLVLRGGFLLSPDDPLYEEGQRTVVMIGNIGKKFWPHFSPHASEGSDPLDQWTRRQLAALPDRFGARAVYPSDKPYLPFQQWAMRSDNVSPSPLGLLIHPDYGLWHAYRAALLFRDVITLADRGTRPRPCDTCHDKPCLSACPVGAFSDTAYDVDACAAHLNGSDGQICLGEGCGARDACPIGREARYHPEEIRFHMAAFHRSRKAK